jgi:hypothetical protein
MTEDKKTYVLRMRGEVKYVPTARDEAAMVLCDLLLERGAPSVPTQPPLTGRYGYRARFIWPLMHVEIDEVVKKLCVEAGLERELELAMKWRSGLTGPVAIAAEFLEEKDE